MTTGFQTQINSQPAPAEAGDFAGINPRASLLNGGAGQYVAPSTGLVVGRFAWANPDTSAVSQTFVSGYQLGFLHRENNAVITAFLGEAVYLVNQGLPAALFDQGDFWALFDAGATPGQRVWADPSTGKPIAGGATAPALDGFTAVLGSSGSIAITTNVATISAVVGWIDAGSTVTSASLGTAVLGTRLTGSAGGAGTFTLVHGDFTIEAYTATNDHMTVSAVSSGVLSPGDEVGSPATAGTQIVSQVSGSAGGIGVYTISIAQYHASTTFSDVAVATPWFVDSVAANGEIAKISTWG